MDNKRLVDLINHWRVLASEAREQGDNATQPGIFRAHAFGVSDGLEIAANDLEQAVRELLENMDNRDGGERRASSS